MRLKLRAVVGYSVLGLWLGWMDRDRGHGAWDSTAVWAWVKAWAREGWLGTGEMGGYGHTDMDVGLGHVQLYSMQHVARAGARWVLDARLQDLVLRSKVDRMGLIDIQKCGKTACYSPTAA